MPNKPIAEQVPESAKAGFKSPSSYFNSPSYQEPKVKEAEKEKKIGGA